MLPAVDMHFLYAKPQYKAYLTYILTEFLYFLF